MFHVSLRELFLVVAVTALAIVSLVTASPLWQAMIGLVAMLSVMIALIVSLVDRGPRRAFAIGFAVAMLGYLIVVMNAHKLMSANQFGGTNENVEFDVYQGRLPTSVALQYVYQGIQRTKHFDAKSGEQIPESESANLWVVAEGFGGMGGGWGGTPPQAPAGKRAAYVEVKPPRENFMVQGHFWWALVFGYVGGHVARFVYLRRERETKSGAS